MRRKWSLSLACLCMVVAMVHSAAVPTQDTMVVARADDEVTTSATPADEAPVTGEPIPPLKLTEMDVRSEVSMRYAHTSVVTRVKNPAKQAQEATFRVLLPDSAFVSSFIMTLDGKSYKAYVKAKEEAKEIYDKAVSQGIGAAHIATKARDSNQIVVSVNVQPESKAEFNLTYEELLVRRNSVYHHAINLHPGAEVPKLTVTIHLLESGKITDLRVPEVRTGNEVDATENDPQNSVAVIDKKSNGREAYITFSPDIEEQRRLMRIYTQKVNETRQGNSDRRYWYNSQNEPLPEGILGQFVVQYDVERSKDGEILVNDGYFVYFYAPTSLPPLAKHVVFVLDTSGSMMDRKIKQLREAMQTILSDLNKEDYFSIVEFESYVTVHDLKEADQEPQKSKPYYYLEKAPKPVLVPPSQATPENIAKAKVIVSRLIASGGTNIGDALDIAVEITRKGIWQKSDSNDTTSTSTTTASPIDEETTCPEDEEDTAVSTDVTKLEPIIIFLTDGDPTVGETNPTVIINRFTEKNSGENKASVFSLAFGEDADRKFLRKLSLRNDGFMRHIYEAADAALQLHDFYQQVSSPLLSDVKFTYPPDQVQEKTLTKHKFRAYYDGSEIIVAGRLAAESTEIEPLVEAFCGVDDNAYGRKRYEIRPKLPIRTDEGYGPLERLWAFLTIKQKLDKIDAADNPDQDKDKEGSPHKEALALALKYEFVTPLTSLVVVKPNATNAVDAESVDNKQNGGSGSIQPSALSGYALPAAPMFVNAPLGAGSFAAFESEDVEYEEPDVMSGAAGVRPAAAYSSGPIGYSVGAVSRLSSSHIRSRYPASSDSFGSAMSFGLAGPGGYPYRPMQFSSVYHPSTTPFYPTLLPTAMDFTDSASSTPVGSPLDKYYLQDYKWVEPLLDSFEDKINLKVNSTDVSLLIIQQPNGPKKAGGPEECAKATDGAPGSCVYLSYCDAARNITADTYKETYCVVEQGYAGVCCPKASVNPKINS